MQLLTKSIQNSFIKSIDVSSMNFEYLFNRDKQTIRHKNENEKHTNHKEVVIHQVLKINDKTLLVELSFKTEAQVD